jgi:hypothetical protein
MAILQGQTNSFKLELFSGVHAFGSTYRAVDVFKMALYSSSAVLGPTTTAYTATNEITGPGYSAGGAILTIIAPLVSSNTVCVSFANPSWTGPLTAAGALIYNSSQGNRSVAVLAFGSNITMQPFVVRMPTDTSLYALIRYA